MLAAKRDRAGQRRLSSFPVGLAVVLLCAFGVRFAYVTRVASKLALGTDSIVYVLVSGLLASGKGYSQPGRLFLSPRPTAGYPPGFPTFLELARHVVGGTDTDLRVSSCLLGVATVALVGFIARRVFGPRVGLVAALLAAFYPLLVAVDGALMSESLYIPLVYLAVLTAFIAAEQRTFGWWAALGTILGAAALTHADGVILAPMLIIPVALNIASRSLRDRLLRASLAMGMAAVVVIPWIIRNEIRMHDPTIATVSSAATFAGANCPSTYHGQLIGYWDFSCIQTESLTQLGEVRWSHALQHQGLSYAWHHIDRLPLVVAVREARVLGLYHPFSQARIEAGETRNYHWQLLGWAIWIPAFLLSIAGIVRKRRESARFVPLLCVLAYVVTTVAITHGNQRFRLTAEPTLLIFAAVAIVDLGNRVHARPLGRPKT